MRGHVAATLALSLATSLSAVTSSPLGAAEVCVACEGPAATYRCSMQDLPKKAYKLGLADKAQSEVCQTVLAKQGEHASCRVVEGAGACDGFARTVTLTDFQRAIAGENETTYQPGALELAQRGMNQTWVCISSLFEDC